MRAMILNALRQEHYVSGEQLGKRLHISRTAVWKHINELRKNGYKIDSSPKLGYSLIEIPDLLLPDEISNGLETRVIGKNILHYSEVTSTQDIAAEFAQNGIAEGTVVIAETQTNGRGRKGRKWISPYEGGVYLSIVLRPNLTPLQTIQMPLIAGVAVRKAIRKTTRIDPRIKWPNDIIIGGKKVAGILTEMSCEIDLVNYVVLGIGLNVNTPKSVIEKIPGGIADSLANKCGELVSRVKLVQHLLNEFEDIYSEFQVNGFHSIREEWKISSNTIGSWVKISDGGDKEGTEGRAFDIDEDGFLLVRKKSGDLVRVISGDVLLN
jgi:BirA family transcriptional regulator, biotin operon repressor / biotin---[acetyl-CoA-carboxylase] ligase